MDKLNLTSDEARTRIGEDVNERYKRVTSSIGLITSRRTKIDVVVDPTSVTSILPDLEIDGIEKVLKISCMVGTRPRLLDELTYEEITDRAAADATPTAFAVKLMGSQMVTIRLNAFPSTTTFTLSVEGYDLADVLDDSAEPAFPEDFHDILIEGALADELNKMEKPQLAQMREARFESRLSDLRMFIAKSAYLDIQQGKRSTDRDKWMFRYLP
jgi:hypothetical protein